jgi:Carboxypeptidase regulatory-like domain
MTTYKTAFAAVLMLAVSGTLGAPQITAQTQTTVTGTIIDAVTGKPVPNVGITVLGSDLTTTTGSDGTYTLTGVPPGLIKVKAQIIGFHPITTPYYNLKPGESERVNFKLAPLRVQLAAVEVVGDRPEERQWAFGSNILTREQLPNQGSVLDALQGTVAGLDSYGEKDDQGVSFRNSSRPVLFVIDGVTVRPPITFYIDVNEVECLEIRKGYRAAQEFRLSITGPTYSGVILIWTRGSVASRPRECGNR